MAATGNDQVKALVYLNGWMCDEGESQQQQPVGVILNGFRTASQSPVAQTSAHPPILRRRTADRHRDDHDGGPATRVSETVPGLRAPKPSHRCTLIP
jgi:hypothetical protein